MVSLDGSAISCGIQELYGLNNITEKEILGLAESNIEDQIREGAILPGRGLEQMFIANTVDQRASERVLKETGFKKVGQFVNARTKAKNILWVGIAKFDVKENGDDEDGFSDDYIIKNLRFKPRKRKHDSK